MGALTFAKEQGLDGVFFRQRIDISQTLDQAQLHDVKQLADEYDLNLEYGIGSVNPFNIPNSPCIAPLANMDYRLAMEQLIQTGKSIDCVELCADLASSQTKMSTGPVRHQRFRTDVEWSDQLLITEKFLKLLAPILREQGCRVNLETHGELSSSEAINLVEAVGPDIVDITFDAANVIAAGEDPIAAARRVAPYAHLTHVKDCILYFDDGCLVQ